MDDLTALKSNDSEDCIKRFHNGSENGFIQKELNEYLVDNLQSSPSF